MPSNRILWVSNDAYVFKNQKVSIIVNVKVSMNNNVLMRSDKNTCVTITFQLVLTDFLIDVMSLSSNGKFHKNKALSNDPKHIEFCKNITRYVPYVL